MSDEKKFVIKKTHVNKVKIYKSDISTYHVTIVRLRNKNGRNVIQILVLEIF